jgi:SAM-dependent methyltransferase
MLKNYKELKVWRKFYQPFQRHNLRSFFNKLRLTMKYRSPWSQASPKQMVEEGYDRVADQYADWTCRAEKVLRAKLVDALLESFPDNTALLDLGCGTGLPSTKRLAERFKVTGVDISSENISRAELNVSNARFIKADMVQLDFPPESFDVVTAFYSIFHVPRSEQPVLLAKIAAWLRGNGFIIATLGANAMASYFERNWLGVPMFWSSFDCETNKCLFENAGLNILKAIKVKEKAFDKWNTFLWIAAQKPGVDFGNARNGNSAFIRFLNDFDVRSNPVFSRTE